MPSSEEMARAVAEWCEPMPAERLYKEHMSIFPKSPAKVWIDTFHGWRPAFSEHSIDCCRVFEDEIKKRGLVGEYIANLFAEALPNGADLPRRDEHDEAIAARWCYATATAEQRLKAAYAVITKEKANAK